MKNFSSFLLYTIFLCTLNFAPSSSQQGKELLCPLPTAILPCTCYKTTSRLPYPELECKGQNIGQAEVNHLFEQVKEANDKSLDRTPIKFVLANTNLTQLDLTPLIGGCFRSIRISGNALLTSIVGPPKFGNNDTTLIDVTFLDIADNPLLTNQGLNQTLPHFTTRVKELVLSRNNIRFEPINSEFLPGLSRLVNLTHLDLSYNNISHISGAPFKNNRNLVKIALGHVGLREVGPAAFDLDPPDHPLAQGVRLVIDMYGNNLGDKGIAVDSGFNQTLRSTLVDLMLNKFVTLEEERFRPFFYGPTTGSLNNTMRFYGNNFICDQRMKWLKVARRDLESRVKGVTCANDPDHDVFTTSKISGAVQVQAGGLFLMFVAVFSYFCSS